MAEVLHGPSPRDSDFSMLAMFILFMYRGGVRLSEKEAHDSTDDGTWL